MSILKPTRLDKNGIPVLDEPRNGLRDRDEQHCLPNRHLWRKTAHTEYRCDEGPVVLWECRSCPETEWVTDNGWARP